jgi:hypothetical protein
VTNPRQPNAAAEARAALVCPRGRSGPCLSEPALSRLHATDVAAAIEAMSDEAVAVLARQAQVRLPVGALRGDGVHVLTQKLRRASGPQAHNAAGLLVSVPWLSLATLPDGDGAEARLVEAAREMAATWTFSLLDVALCLFAELDPEAAPAVEAARSRARDEAVGGAGPPAPHDGEEPVAAGEGARTHDRPDPSGGWSEAPSIAATTLLERAVTVGRAVAPDFGALDELVVRAACTAVGRADDAGRARAAAAEWCRGGASETARWFVAGFVDGLLAAPTQGSLALDLDEAAEPCAVPPGWARAAWVGRVQGLHERGDSAALGPACAADPGRVREVVTRPEGFLLAAPLLVALLDERPDALPAALGEMERPVLSWRTLATAVLERVSGGPTRARAAPEADALLGALDAALTRWAALAYDGDAVAASELEGVAASVALVRAARRRGANDFVGARALLDRIEGGLLPPGERGHLARERALCAAEVALPEHVGLPGERAGRARLGARLRPAGALLADAVGRRPADSGLLWLRALAVHCAEGGAGAPARHEFEAFLRAAGDAVEWAHARASARFHLGLVCLAALEPGTDRPAVSAMVAALGAGHRPSSEQVAAAVDALEAHASPALPEFLEAMTEVALRVPEALGALGRLAASGSPKAVSFAARLGGTRGLRREDRFALLESALAGMEGEASAATSIEAVVDAFDDLLCRSRRDDLDARWADLLAHSEALRDALDPVHADLERVHVLSRLGRDEEAGAIARRLFFGAASGELPDLAPAGLLELVEDLGALDDAVARRAAAHARRSCGVGLSGPVRVIFAGGDERQARMRPGVEAALGERFGADLAVSWYFPGWSASWAGTAEGIEARYGDADAVVLMALVRTQFGRRIRASAGEAGLPWVACTGHGRGAILHAIEHAADVVERLRTPTAGPG